MDQWDKNLNTASKNLSQHSPGRGVAACCYSGPRGLRISLIYLSINASGPPRSGGNGTLHQGCSSRPQKGPVLGTLVPSHPPMAAGAAGGRKGETGPRPRPIFSSTQICILLVSASKGNWPFFCYVFCSALESGEDTTPGASPSHH